MNFFNVTRVVAWKRIIKIQGFPTKTLKKNTKLEQYKQYQIHIQSFNLLVYYWVGINTKFTTWRKFWINANLVNSNFTTFQWISAIIKISELIIIKDDYPGRFLPATCRICSFDTLQNMDIPLQFDFLLSSSHLICHLHSN